MKTLKFALALAATLVVAQVASAQTTVRIVGSSAYRAAVVQAIQNIYSPAPTVGYVGSSLSGSTYAIFNGTVTGVAGTVTVKTAFSGSTGGVQTVANGLQVGSQFLPSNGFLNNSVLTGIPTGTTAAVTSPVYETNQVADVAFSDAFSRNTGQTNTNPNVPAANLRGAIVGVVPFVFVVKPNADAQAITDINSTQVQQLLLGTLRLSSFGLADTTRVRAVGRDEDSGTRVAALAVSGYGVNSQVAQYQPRDASNTPVTLNTQTVTQLVLYPSEPLYTLGGLGTVQTQTGDAGFSSGGQLAAALSAANASPAWLGSYLGVNDARTAVGASAPARLLSYNGNTFPLSGSAASQGQAINAGYEFWGYEHLYVADDLETRGGTSATQVVQLVGRQVLTTTASISGVPANALTVTRADDGAPIDFTSGALPPEDRPFNLGQ